MSFCEKYVGNYLDDYVSIVHAPTADKPFGKMYTVKYLGNVVGGLILPAVKLLAKKCGE